MQTLYTLIAAVDYSPLIAGVLKNMFVLIVPVLGFLGLFLLIVFLRKMLSGRTTYSADESIRRQLNADANRKLQVSQQALVRGTSVAAQATFNQSSAEPDYPYALVDRILSPAEERFSHALMEAVGDDWVALVKIRLADVLDITTKGKGYMSAFGRISQKHVDFLLIDPETTAPLLAIELDDRSHLRPDRQERDAFVDAALAAAGLPIIHIRCVAQYDAHQLRQQIHSILRPFPTQEPTPDMP